jgi:N-acetylmuramoyl-L-alanine amidase
VDKRYYFFLSVILVCLNSGCATAPPKANQPAIISPGGACHIVVKGQTLWRISKIYNVDVQELMRVNGITDSSGLAVGQRLIIPGAMAPFAPGLSTPFFTGDVESIVGTKHYSSRWKTITIHHSATIQGNAEAFNRNHRQRGMGGLFYHFVIGNGLGSQDGEIEVGKRWTRQTQVNRPNDIQICLVGDFNRQRVSDRQFGSLVKLITVLRRQYNIPLRNIRRHKSIRGKHTDCPGQRFPFDRLILELRNIQA